MVGLGRAIAPIRIATPSEGVDENDGYPTGMNSHILSHDAAKRKLKMIKNMAPFLEILMSQ